MKSIIYVYLAFASVCASAQSIEATANRIQDDLVEGISPAFCVDGVDAEELTKNFSELQRLVKKRSRHQNHPKLTSITVTMTGTGRSKLLCGYYGN